jgi:hypothetical protein
MRFEQMGIILEFEGNDREILLRNLQNLNFLELIHNFIVNISK